MKKEYYIYVPGTKGLGYRFQYAGCEYIDSKGNPCLKPEYMGRLKARRVYSKCLRIVALGSAAFLLKRGKVIDLRYGEYDAEKHNERPNARASEYANKHLSKFLYYYRKTEQGRKEERQ